MKKPKIDQQDGFLIDDILGQSAADPLETEYMPGGRALTLSPRLRYERIHQKQQLLDVVPTPPGPGETIHVIGNGQYDFWTWVPQILDWIGTADDLYCSTWTLSRPNAVELFRLIDAGRIQKISFLTGLYFKRREAAVYSILLNGIRARGGRYRALKNHAKVLLLGQPATETYLTVEGSANLTANPRIENYTITNGRDLYEFHRGWIEEALTK